MGFRFGASGSPSRKAYSKVVALNNLFKELVSVEVSPKELLEAVFADARVMDYFTFERRLNAWKQELVAGHDLDKVRIKLAGEDA